MKIVCNLKKMSSISEQGNATETFCMKNALKSALKLQKVIQKNRVDEKDS